MRVLIMSDMEGVSGIIKHFVTMSKGGPSPHHANAMETAGSVIVPEFGYMKQLYIVDALRFGETTRGPQYYQKSLLFGTRTWDIPTLAAVAAVLGLSALAASFLPAHRAASINPVDALRAE